MLHFPLKESNYESDSLSVYWCTLSWDEKALNLLQPFANNWLKLLKQWCDSQSKEALVMNRSYKTTWAKFYTHNKSNYPWGYFVPSILIQMLDVKDLAKIWMDCTEGNSLSYSPILDGQDRRGRIVAKQPGK